MKRRSNLDIPEFYAGSILRVDYADPYATNGQSGLHFITFNLFTLIFSFNDQITN